MNTRTLVISIAAGALVSLAGHPSWAQSSRFIQTLDVNGDGKVSRDELQEGSAKRRVFDGLVEKKKLDPKKAYTLKELEEAADLSVAASPSSSSNSSGGPFRLGDPRRGSLGARPSRPASGGRPYRALEELPDKYRSHDKDGDGQVGLYEWPKDRIAEFLSLDRNDDGFLTIIELKKFSPPTGDKVGEKDKKPDAEKPSSDAEKS